MENLSIKQEQYQRARFEATTVTPCQVTCDVIVNGKILTGSNASDFMTVRYSPSMVDKAKYFDQGILNGVLALSTSKEAYPPFRVPDIIAHSFPEPDAPEYSLYHAAAYAAYPFRGTMLTYELFRLNEGLMERYLPGQPRLKRPYFQKTVLSTPVSEVQRVLRHGNAFYPGTIVGRPSPMWKNVGERKAGEIPELYQDMLPPSEADPTFTVTLPIQGQTMLEPGARYYRSSGLWGNNLIDTESGRALIAKLFCLLKGKKSVELIAEYPGISEENRKMWKFGRVMVADTLTYLLAADPNTDRLPLSFITDPISTTGFDLIFRNRNEGSPNFRVAGKNYIPVDPQNLGSASEEEKKIADLLALFSKNFTAGHNKLMRGAGQKLF